MSLHLLDAPRPRFDVPDIEHPDVPGKTAIVLSGGGAEGAYQVGILKALCSGLSPATDYQPLEPEIFAGTSIGSLNAAFLASHWERLGTGAVDALEELWLERIAHNPGSCGNGLYRFRIDPLRLATPSCYFPNPLQPFLDLAKGGATVGWDGLQRLVHVATESGESLSQRLSDLVSISSFVSTEPFDTLLREVIDYPALRRRQHALRIVATNWATGKLRIFENLDMTDDSGPKAILASSSVPGFFPPTHLGSQPFVDGGVLLNAPLAPAIRAGASKLYVIYMDPDIQNIPFSGLENTLETFYRMQQIGWAAAINDDISDAERINKGLAIVAQLGHPGSGDEKSLRPFVEAASQLHKHLGSGRLRPLLIRRFHPRDPLGGTLGFLNLDRGQIERFIDRGFQDAISHDASASRDIVPSVPVLSEARPVEEKADGPAVTSEVLPSHAELFPADPCPTDDIPTEAMPSPGDPGHA